jgi:2-keto-3-deoxy-L-rhamnonate aldolase RhmA
MIVIEKFKEMSIIASMLEISTIIKVVIGPSDVAQNVESGS